MGPFHRLSRDRIADFNCPGGIGFARTGKSIPSFCARSKISVELESPGHKLNPAAWNRACDFHSCSDPVFAGQICVHDRNIHHNPRHDLKRLFCAEHRYSGIAPALKQHAQGFCDVFAVCCISDELAPCAIPNGSTQGHLGFKLTAFATVLCVTPGAMLLTTLFSPTTTHNSGVEAGQ